MTAPFPRCRAGRGIYIAGARLGASSAADKEEQAEQGNAPPPPPGAASDTARRVDRALRPPWDATAVHTHRRLELEGTGISQSDVVGAHRGESEELSAVPSFDPLAHDAVLEEEAMLQQVLELSLHEAQQQRQQEQQQ